MKKPREIDVVIVGGGPAGLSAALSLIARDSAWADRMVVLEMATHPRHKLCAGGLTWFALKHLKRMGLQLTIPLIKSNTASFVYRELRVDVAGSPAVAVSRRQEFDAWLARQAEVRGVNLRQGRRVRQITRTDDGVLIDCDDEQYLAKVLIGADGSRGIVRRWLGAREAPPHVARMLEYVSPAAGTEPEYMQGFARFDFSPAQSHLQGYFWDFPSVIDGKPHMNRGLYDGRTSGDRPRADLMTTLNEISRQRQDDSDQMRIEGHPIHWFSPWNRVAAERVLLVGDAVGAEPLLGEGIGIALGHGQVAAAAVEAAFLRSDFSFGNYRRRLLLSDVGGYTMLRWSVARLVYRWSNHDWFMRFVFGVGYLVARVLGPLPHVDGVLRSPAFSADNHP